MTSPSSKKPMNWEDYEYGRSPRQGSTGSLGSHVQFDAPISATTSDRLNVPRESVDGGSTSNTLRHRRSSLSVRINSLAQAGGPNSLENFARSWSRAAVFPEIPQRQPSFVVSEVGEESLGSKRSGQGLSPGESRSLLRQQLEQEGTQPECVIDDESTVDKDDEEAQSFLEVGRSSSPFSSSYSGVYGSLPSGTNEALLRESHSAYQEQQGEYKQFPDPEEEPLLIKIVEQKDGKRIKVVVGRSTLPQTVFNSVNILIGIGMLSLSLGLKQSGWIIGMTFLFLAAVTTRYTAGLLARCLDLDQTLVTFSDIAYKAFGTKIRLVVGALFSFELLAACVALLVLFADSLDALVPGWGVSEWKILCGIILFPLSFVPLRYLSVTSVLGIISCLGIAILIIVDGLVKPHAPGSLRKPAGATLLPTRWSDLPLSFGLLMSPWGGHGVFPNIYRDMRHPQKYTKAVNYTFVFSYLLDLAIAVAGYLMFGQGIRDEVTSNILLTDGYPHALAICIVVFIAIIPITKVPLNARPIVAIFEDVCGLHLHQESSSGSTYKREIVRVVIRAFTLAVMVLLAILVPSFDTVMALLGSAMAFSICIILPMAFHLKLFYKELGKTQRAFHWFLIVICTIMAIIGTVWVFLPQDLRYGLD